MAKHHLTHRGAYGDPKLLVQSVGGDHASTLVVGIFVVAKFTEGAWLIVIIFPVLVLMFGAAQPEIPRRGFCACGDGAELNIST